MKSFRDVERRLAELERQTAWRQVATERTQRHWEIDVEAIIETMFEAGVLPHPDLFDDEDVWMAAVLEELARMHRAQYAPYAGGCGDPACDVCSA